MIYKALDEYSKRDLNPHSHYWPKDFKSFVSTIPPSGQPALRRGRWRKSAAKLRQLLKLCKFHAQKLTSIYRCGCGQRRWGSEWHGGAAVDAVPGCASGGAPRRTCVDACAPDALSGEI